jgi:hypothetical protein
MMAQMIRLTHCLLASVALGGLASAQLGAPANDTCTTAQDIGSGPTSMSVPPSLATSEGTHPSCATSAAPDVWFEWTPHVDGGSWTFWGCDITTIQVWDDCSGTPLGCQTMTCGPGAGALEISGLSAGTTYLIQVIQSVYLEIAHHPDPAPNGSCATATVLNPGPTSTLTNTYGASSQQTFSHSWCGDELSPDLWYSWTPTTNGRYRVRLVDADYPSAVGFYGTCPITNFDSSLACGNSRPLDSEILTHSLSAGVPYLIRVGTTQFSGYGTATLEITPGNPIPNDTCATATDIGSDLAFTASNLGATDSNLPCPGFGSSDTHVWFRWTAPTTDSYSIRGMYAGKAWVYDSAACDAVAPLACGYSYSNYTVEFSAALGQSYFVAIGMGDVNYQGTASAFLIPGSPQIEFGYTRCETMPNSAFEAGALTSAIGSSSLTANDLTLVTTGAVPGQFGMYFYGPGQASTAFGDGYRCVGLPLVRLRPPVLADSAGSVTLAVDMSASPVSLLTNGYALFQFVYRDPANQDPSSSRFNISSALQVYTTP